jgi:hypothetical protein
MTRDPHRPTATEAAAHRRERWHPTSRRRNILAAVLGILGGTAALVVPTSVDVAVASFSNPGTTSTTTLCPNGTDKPMYVRTYYDSTSGRYVSVYAVCDPATGNTYRRCHYAANPGKPSGTPSLGACPT